MARIVTSESQDHPSRINHAELLSQGYTYPEKHPLYAPDPPVKDIVSPDLDEESSTPVISILKQAKTRQQLREYWREQYAHIDSEHIGPFFSKKQEQSLAVDIQAGKAARGVLTTRRRMSADRRKELQDAVDCGDRASTALVEMHIDFAYSLARASVGITSGQGRHPLDDESGYQKQPSNPKGTYKPFHSMKSPYADLEHRFMSALEALYQSAQTYEPDKDARFATYAAWNIQSQIERDMHREEHNGIRIPTYQHGEINAFFNNNRSGETSPDEAVSRLLAITSYISLDDLSARLEAESGESLDERYGNTSSDSPDIASVEKMLSDTLETVFYTLSEREAGVIGLRYGINDDVPRMLDEIARTYGLSRERIRQIEKNALSKLRHPSRLKLLKGFTALLSEGLTTATETQYGRQGDGSLALGRTSLYAASIPYKKEADIQPPTLDQYRMTEELEAWQIHQGEKWETPVRLMPNSGLDEVLFSRIHDLLKDIQPYHFQISFGKSVNTPYPVGLANHIVTLCGKNKLSHAQVRVLESTFYNQTAPRLIDEIGDDFSYDRMVSFFDFINHRLRLPLHLDSTIAAPDSTDDERAIRSFNDRSQSPK